MSMMKRTELISRLNSRKSEWTSIAKQADVSRKTIERTAKGETDPKLTLVETLSLILKK